MTPPSACRARLGRRGAHQPVWEATHTAHRGVGPGRARRGRPAPRGGPATGSPATAVTCHWVHLPLGSPGTGVTGHWGHRPLGSPATGVTGHWGDRPLGRSVV